MEAEWTNRKLLADLVFVCESMKRTEGEAPWYLLQYPGD
jgi:hypothetical protein